MKHHPFQYELASTEANGYHIIQWIAPVRVNKPRILIAADGLGMKVSVTVAGIPLPGGAALWVESHATAVPSAPHIGVGQQVWVGGERPFSILVEGTVPNLPGKLPAGMWVSYPNRVGPVECDYRRVRRVQGIQEGDTVVFAPGGEEVAIDARGFLVTPVLLCAGETLRRSRDLSQPGLTLIGDSIMPAATVWIVGDYLADATCFAVDADGNEVGYSAAEALEAIKADKAAMESKLRAAKARGLGVWEVTVPIPPLDGLTGEQAAADEQDAAAGGA